MSKMIEINWQPDERTLRQFGAIALAGFGLLAILAWNELLVFSLGLGSAKPLVAGGFAALGLLSGLFSLIAPHDREAGKTRGVSPTFPMT